MGIFDRLLGKDSKGRLGSSAEPTTVDIHDKPLECLVCRHDYFWRHEVQLNTPAMTFLDVEWLNRVATCAVCARCGYIHWFLPPRA